MSDQLVMALIDETITTKKTYLDGKNTKCSFGLTELWSGSKKTKLWEFANMLLILKTDLNLEVICIKW